jgi:hypothetical protein
MTVLLAAILATLVFGLDAVLNGISIALAVVVVLVFVIPVLAGLGFLFWVLARDAVVDIKSDRQHGRAWRWRCVAYIGFLGIAIDGLVGAWNAYQQHVLYSMAVEQIPFVGVPVFVALASFPLKWIETALIKLRKRNPPIPDRVREKEDSA